ncbi:MAG: ferredoxin [Actinomycetota bacterium]|nr:ferredoxin [Actinomycetota bacterium]
MPWVARGLREGIVTTRYPRRPDDHGPDFVAAVTVTDQPAEGAGQGLAGLCPTGAISVGPPVAVDRGRCILCGHCVDARPEMFAYESSPGTARLHRRLLVTPPAPGDDDLEARVRAELAARVRRFGRSLHIRHVDAGSDGSEEWEIAALTGPIYDVHRLGIFFTASPRHADVLLVTGAGTAGMAEPLQRTYHAMPDPKVVVAVGTDAISGGLVHPTYVTRGGVAGLLPVDVWVPGSPPSPFSILHGLLLAMGRLGGTRPLRARGRG